MSSSAISNQSHLYPLLADDSNSSDQNDNDINYSKVLQQRRSLDISNSGCCRQFSYRRSRKMTRCVLIFVAILLVLLLIYIPLFSNVQSRLTSIPGWSYNTSRNPADYVLPGVETALIKPRSICLSNFFLLIVVCSSVENFDVRQTIRETWGNVSEFNYPMFSKMHSHLSGQYLDISELSLRLYSNHLNLRSDFNNSSQLHNLPVRLVFLIGKGDESRSNKNETIAKLKLESEQYDDIVQEAFHDSYNNLTIKSIMMLKWVVDNCQNRAKFLMKCDDDTFVNVPNLLHMLLGGTIPVYNATVTFYDPVTVNALSPSNRMTRQQNFLTGYLFCLVKPVADTSSKWYSPAYMFKGDVYPNYLSGSSYLMSFDVVPKLYNISLKTPLLHLEDVYLTGICAEKIKVKRRHSPLFSFVHSPNRCSYRGVITQHYIKGELMRDVYTFTVSSSHRCPPADKYFKVKKLRKRFKYCQ